MQQLLGSQNSHPHRLQHKDRYRMFLSKPTCSPPKHLYYTKPHDLLPASRKGENSQQPQKSLQIHKLEDLVNSPFKEQLKVRYKQIRDTICKNYTKNKNSPRKLKPATTLSNQEFIQQLSSERMNSNPLNQAAMINDLD